MTSGVYIRTEEHLKIMSDSHKGFPAWNKGLKGYKSGEAHWTYGKPRTEETKLKISMSKKGMTAWNKGKPMPNAAKNLGEYSQVGKKRGEKSPTWKGGTYGTERHRAMGQIEYTLWRNAVFERDNYTCRMCSQYSGYLQADHKKPWAVFPELRYAIDNGMTLCKNCHKLKTKMDWQEYQFKAVKEVS